MHKAVRQGNHVDTYGYGTFPIGTEIGYLD